jgi:hypothetical protein
LLLSFNIVLMVHHGMPPTLFSGTAHMLINHLKKKYYYLFDCSSYTYSKDKFLKKKKLVSHDGFDRDHFGLCFFCRTVVLARRKPVVEKGW